MTHARGLLAVSLVALLSIAPAASRAQASAPAMTPAERHDWESAHRVSKILGTEVRTKFGEKVGDIRDIVVDDRGAIRLAIVSTGGFLGVGDRLHAVPWDLLAPGPKDDRILDIDKARLQAAPGFTSRTWPNLGDDRWLAANRRYYVH
ncbi:MAG: PRC-barrel domain-containing protein [Burkholderiaceae bacterium]